MITQELSRGSPDVLLTSLILQCMQPERAVMTVDRRNYTRRGEVIDRIVHRVVRNPSARFTFRRFRTMLGVPDAAARRILGCLTSTGLLVEVERGIWARSH